MIDHLKQFHEIISDERSSEESAGQKSDHLPAKLFPMIDHRNAKLIQMSDHLPAKLIQMSDHLNAKTMSTAGLPPTVLLLPDDQ